jgi:hypothetical protein
MGAIQLLESWKSGFEEKIYLQECDCVYSSHSEAVIITVLKSAARIRLVKSEKT